MKLADLQQRRAAFLKEARAILRKAEDQNRSLTQKEAKTFDELTAKADGHSVQLCALSPVRQPRGRDDYFYPWTV